MPTHVSIHDVSPAFAQEVEDALTMCYDAGTKPALLVVPNFHGTWALSRYPKFQERLRTLQAEGHEIFLHGFFHKAGMGEQAAEGRPPRLRRLFAQKVASAGEAEFADIGWKEGDQRLDEGEAMLAAAGLRIDGFVAPAWSMASWVLTMLRERGYRYTEDHFHVYDPKRGTSRRSLVMNFASRTPARLWSSVAFCRVARPARRVLPARIALHPGDMQKDVLRREAKNLLEWGKGDFVPRATDLFT